MVRKTKYLSLLVCFLLTSLLSFGQSRKEKKADRNFDTYAYVDAIQMYENMAEQGYINTSILSKLGDSYYFNAKFVEANKWYEQLIEGSYEDKDLTTLNKEYYYRYAQTLKAVDQPQKADAILEEFATLAANDSRAQLFITNSELVEKTLPSSRFTLSNLSCNSEYSDYGATLLGNQLIFTSSRVNDQMKNKIHNWTNQAYTKLYTTTIGVDGGFGEPVLFAKEIASKELNMGTAIFTKDGKTMYFTSNNGSIRGGKRAQYNKEESSVLKIYVSHQQPDGSWGGAESLAFNLEDYNTAHPALTPDEKWMYFVSDRQGSLGQSDLFRVSRFEDGHFGPVEHLGDKVNTAGRETFPFISSDYTLYFSSDGHPGFGGLDVFKVKIQRDGQLGVPVNLGPDINSAFDDFGLYIDSATKKGFITSNKPGGHGGDDLYLFIEQACTQLVDGLISNQEGGEYLDQVVIGFYDAMNKKVAEIQSDSQGYFSFDQLACGREYLVRASKKGYLTKEMRIHTNREVKERLYITLESDGTRIGQGDDLFDKLKLSPIYFDFDKSTIRPDAQIELMKVVEVMKQHPSLVVDIRSHTDSRGNDRYNRQLSDRRAKATMQWMISKGIAADRLTGKGYGESQLLNKCSKGIPCSEEEHQVNRRSEFIILNL